MLNVFLIISSSLMRHSINRKWKPFSLWSDKHLPKNKNPKYFRSSFSWCVFVSQSLRCCHVSSRGPHSERMFILWSLWRCLWINTWEGDGLHVLQNSFDFLSETAQFISRSNTEWACKTTLIMRFCFKHCRLVAGGRTVSLLESHSIRRAESVKCSFSSIRVSKCHQLKNLLLQLRNCLLLFDSWSWSISDLWWWHLHHIILLSASPYWQTGWHVIRSQYPLTRNTCIKTPTPQVQLCTDE